MDRVDDGCTAFYDEWRGNDIRPCCDTHDLQWLELSQIPLTLDNWFDWITIWFWSNWDLATCFVQAGAPEIAPIAFALVSSVGTIFFLFMKDNPLVKIVKQLVLRSKDGSSRK